MDSWKYAYSKICSFKVIKEFADVTEVAISHVAEVDHIIYILLYIRNHTVDELLKGSRGIPHSTWPLLVKGMWCYKT